MAKFLTERIRAELGIPIVWGGMHPTFLPELCIPIADAISVGEVDHAVVDFFVAMDEGKDIRRCKSFWVRDENGITKNELARLVELDDIPFRDFHTQDDKFHVEGKKVTQRDPFITCL